MAGGVLSLCVLSLFSSLELRCAGSSDCRGGWGLVCIDLAHLEANVIATTLPTLSRVWRNTKKIDPKQFWLLKLHMKSEI